MEEQYGIKPIPPEILEEMRRKRDIAAESTRRETIEVEQPEVEERQEPEPIVEPEEKGKNDMSDLFEVPQSTDNDMATDDLLETGAEEGGPEEDDLSDLTSVDFDRDIMGDDFGGRPASEEAPLQKPRYRITKPGRRAIRKEPPQAGMSGVRY